VRHHRGDDAGVMHLLPAKIHFTAKVQQSIPDNRAVLEDFEISREEAHS
jgi:hypothetical protein